MSSGDKRSNDIIRAGATATLSSSVSPSESREELEEEELGIYSDEDDGEDLSDNEPPITEQDTSGRPQSQVSEMQITAGHTGSQIRACPVDLRVRLLTRYMLRHVHTPI